MKNVDYGIVVQARMGSTRLPGKVLRNFNPSGCILDFLLRRLKTCTTISSIVVATTDKERDDRIVALSRTLGVETFRGSESNVLDRFLRCANEFQFNNIVRVTADNPFTDPDALDSSVNRHRELGLDYVTQEGVVLGTASEVVSVKALEREMEDPRLAAGNCEHVTTFILEHPGEFDIDYLHFGSASEALSGASLTVDTLEDFDHVEKIVSEIEYDFTISRQALLHRLSRR